MRDLAILTFQTLDGVMQAPSDPKEDFSNDFKHGGWGRVYWTEVMQLVQKEAMNKPYDLLLGRNTYDLFAEHNSNDDIDNPLNEMTKYVVSNSEMNLTWKNTTQVSGNIVEEIAKLKSQKGPLLQVHGSWDLIQTLVNNNLVDEFRIWTFPVVVGSGKRLFSNLSDAFNLSLIKTDTTSNGVSMTFYKNENAI